MCRGSIFQRKGLVEHDLQLAFRNISDQLLDVVMNAVVENLRTQKDARQGLIATHQA